MKLPPELKKNILNELEFVIKKMKEEPDLLQKLYFYSAVKGALERATRLHFDKELLVAHTIADFSYVVINDRINHLRSGDNTVPFPENLLTQLLDGVSEMRQAIEKDEVTYPAVEKIMEVAYMATGPGFYTRSFLDYVGTKQHSQEESK
jgi:hypothetical protein